MDPNIQTTQQTVQPQKSSVNVFWIYLIAILLAIALGISGYFIGFEQALGKKLAAVPKTSTQTQPALSAGFKKAQNNIRLHAGLLASTRITQNYSGKLTFLIPEKIWTLQKNGKTVTINNETNSKVNYYIKSSEPNTKSQLVDTAPFKIGDAVTISTFFPAGGGKTKIDRITLILPSQNPLPVTSSPSAVNKK